MYARGTKTLRTARRSVSAILRREARLDPRVEKSIISIEQVRLLVALTTVLNSIAPHLFHIEAFYQGNILIK